MIDPKIINDISEKLAEVIPKSATIARQDLEKNFKSILQGALSKMDLVTREEFDAQVQVLQRTRTKLEMLQKKLDEMEGSNNQ